MAWSGGNFTRANPTWTTDAGLGIGIEAGRHDTQDNDFTTGINECLNKTGQNQMTGNLNLGGYIATNAASGTAAAPAICAGNDQDTGFFSPAANQIGIATNGTEKIRIDASGNVGLGTTTPSAVVDVHNALSVPILNTYRNDAAGSGVFFQKSRSATVGTNTIVQNGDALGSIYFNGANGTGYSEAALIRAAVDGTPGATNDMPGRLQFYTTPDGSGSLSERMRITSSGQIGFGTTTPTSFYEFLRGANDNGTSLGLVNNNSGSSASCTLHFGNNISNTAAGIIYNSSANTTNAGANGMTIFQNAGSGRIRVLAVSGGVDLTSGATSWAAVSDERLKKNVQPLAYGLNELLAINPIRFDYKTDESNDSKRIGFSAQNVKPLVPEAVTGDEESFYGLSATELIPVLVNAIKELEARVVALEA